MSHTDDNDIMYFIQPQNPTDFLVQKGHIVTVALLAETSEIVQILPDLRGCHIHSHAELIG